MDDYVVVGKIINTFGIKGELKILSDFEYKDRIFKKNFNIYIGKNKIKEVIDNYRIHQKYDLILFKNYNNINEVLKYKNNIIYVKRKELNLDNNEYLLDDLINFKVYDNDIYLGEVVSYVKNNINILLKVKGDREFYLPKVDYFIKNVDLDKKIIITNKGRELL